MDVQRAQELESSLDIGEVTIQNVFISGQTSFLAHPSKTKLNVQAVSEHPVHVPERWVLHVGQDLYLESKL